MSPSIQLRRNSSHRWIAGVAAGLSDFFGIDVTLIRVAFVLLSIFTGGVGVLVYLICWLVIPATFSNRPDARQRRGLAWVLVVSILAIMALVAIRDNFFGIIAVAVILLALWIWRRVRHRQSWKSGKDFERARLAWQRRLDEHANQANTPTNLGGNPFHIDSFYPQPSPPDDNNDNSNSGFQTQ